MPIGDIANTSNLVLSGDVKVDSTKAKHGNKSVRFDGTGDFIETGLNTKFDHGAGDYTIEGWVYAEALGGNNVIASMDQDQTNFGVSQVGSGGASGSNVLYIPFDSDLNDDAQSISAQNVNSYGTPVVQNGQAKFSSASPFFTGSAGQLLLRYDAPEGEDFSQTGDFIIEGWVWQNGSAGGGGGARNPRFFTLTNDSVTAGSNQNLFGQNIFVSFGARNENSTLTVAVKSPTDSASGTSFSAVSGIIKTEGLQVGAYNNQAWRHFFLARKGSKLVVGYNGQILNVDNSTGTLFSGATRFYLGGLPTSNTNAYNMFHAGYFDDVRFLSGTVNDYFTESVAANDTYTVPSTALGLLATQPKYYLFAEDKITGNEVIQTSGTEYTANQWNYVSWARSSGTLSISLNGTQVSSGDFSPAPAGAPSGNKLKIGAGTVANTEWQGWMDEVRVTKGNARYGASAYSTPTNMHGGSTAMKQQRRRITLAGIPAAANSAAIAAAGSGSGTPVVIQAWGAGGGGRASGGGGGGGYATAEYEIQSGVELTVLVGGGGRGGARAPSSLGENPIGGGGGAGQGGALVGVFTAPAAGFNPASAPTVDALHDAALVIAGSGGGGSVNHPSPNKYGGQGGGTTGGDGSPQQQTPRTNHPSGRGVGAAGSGGTQTDGGIGGENFPFGVPSPPTGRAGDGGKLLGGNMSGGPSRGGGGAGYYGGGAGGAAPPNRSSSGGGGSGYFATTGLPSDISFVASSGTLAGGTPGLSGNPARTKAGPAVPGSAPATVGLGGHSPGPKHAPGGPGYVVVTVDGSATEFSAPGSITIP